MLLALYLIAITAEAMTAALAAGRRDMDWIGVCIIACVTALGGGTLRDVVLGHYPVTWVLHPEYLWITAGDALFTALIAPLKRRLRDRQSTRLHSSHVCSSRIASSTLKKKQ